MSATPNRKLKVFLCHASEDKPTVRELYSALKSQGWIDPWLDEEKIFPGQDWDLEIKKAVENADAVIVVLSRNSVDKEGYVQKEIRKILDVADEKPEGTIFLIPLRLDDCSLPRRLTSRQYVDFFPVDVQRKAYKRLVKSLKMRAAKQKRMVGENNFVIQGQQQRDIYDSYTNTHKHKVEKKWASSKKKSTTPLGKLFLTILIAAVLFFLILIGNYVLKINSIIPNIPPTNTYIAMPSQFFTITPTIPMPEIPPIESPYPTRVTDTLTPQSTITMTATLVPTSSSTISPISTQSLGKIISLENAHAIERLYQSDEKFDVWDIDFSPDGSQILIGGTGSPDYKAKIWNYRDGVFEELPVGFHPVAYSTDGNKIVVARGSGSGDEVSLIARIFPIDNLSDELALYGMQAYITHVEFFPDGTRVATGSLDDKIVIWDTNSGEMLDELTFDSQVNDFSIGPRGRYIAVTGFLRDQKIYLYDFQNEGFVNEFSGEAGTSMAVEISPNGKLVASADGMNADSYNIYIWNVADGSLVHILRGHEGKINSLSFSPDGQMLVSLDRNNILFWNVLTGELVYKEYTSPGTVSVQFDPTGRFVGVCKIFPDESVVIYGVR